jgi:peptidoglycan/LPS O-acetylase OafA/YrhL
VIFSKQINKIRLDDLCSSRENNFKLIRLILSISVILTHCFWVFDGGVKNDPLLKHWHMALGDLAVILFFIISGFLISKSYLENEDVIYFIKSRILRIYPAVIIITVLTAIMGFFLVEVSFSDYFFSKEIFNYLYKNCLLIFDVRNQIGFNIFQFNPLGGQINPPLWTLTWELKLYLTILLIFSFSKLFHNRTYFNILFLIMTFVFFFFSDIIGRGGYFPIYFYTGVFFYMNRKDIPLNKFYFFSSILLLYFINNTVLERLFLPLVFSYLILFSAYFQAEILLKFNDFGDYSFGLYVFSFPIQQMLVHFKIPSLTLLFVVSLFISFLFAYISYYFIESKALRLKIKKVHLIT